MKHIPGKSVTKRMTAEEAAILARQDKRKLIILTLGLAVLVAAFVVSTMSANRKKAEEDARLLGGVANQSGPLTTEVFVPDFPDRAILDAVADKTESEQVILNEPAVLAVLKYTQKLTPMQLDQLGMRNLTAEDIQAIASDPAQHRLDARRARGRVLQVRAKAGTDAAPGTIQGTMETTDGLRLHFVVGDAGKDELPNDVLRLDGFFVQMYKTEAQREWITAPLFVGRRLIPSYAPLVLDENLDTPALAKVTDDQIGDVTGIPEEAKWELMAKAIQGKDRIDWAQAPEINDEYIGRMLAGDPSLRGQPFRIPVRINADSRTVRAGENPLMRDTFMEGWIGDYTSKKGNGLIHWTGAFDNPALHDFQGSARFVTGRGFFLKSYVYETSDGKPGKVPYFVMESVNVETPHPDKTHTQALWAMLGLTIVMLAVITWLLSRDKRQTEALQRRLVERRRARQAQQDS